MNLPLNIDWQQILLHLFNFVILFGVLYFLLYKPVKDFMDKRTEYFKKLDDDTKSNLENAEKTKEEYIARLAAVDEEISHKKAEAVKELEEKRSAKIKQAELEAEKILEDTKKSLEIERIKMLREAQTEISGMVVAATEKIVLQSSASESFDQFLAAVERGGDSE